MPHNKFTGVIKMGVKNYKYSYVYKITNILTNEYYIGVRSCNCEIHEDPYMGSGLLIVRSINKHGLENFKKEILKVFHTRAEASFFEAESVTEITLKDPLCLNLKTGGEVNQSVKYSQQACEKLSNSLKKYFQNPENLEKLSLQIKRYFQENPEARQCVSERRKKLLQDPLHLLKAKEAREKLWKDPSHKLKIIAVTTTPEALAKRSLSGKKYAATEAGLLALSKATKDSIYINKDGVTKRVKEAVLQDFLNKGWVLGSARVISDETAVKLKKAITGRKWMFNSELKINKRIVPELVKEYLNNGWELGHKKWKNCTQDLTSESSA